jgi:L-fucose isomerase-like protein
MINPTTIAVLPIGEFDTDPVKNEFDAVIGALNHLQTNLIVSDPVSGVEQARQSVQTISEKNPDLLLLVVLRGLSAETIEAAARTSPAPCLVLPLQGKYALPSSALAVGALQETKVPIELCFAPPDHPEFTRRLGCFVRAAKAYSQIRKCRIGVVGTLFPNLVTCRYDAHILASRLGITLLPISFDALRHSIQTISGNIHAVEESHKETISAFKVDTADRNALDAGIKLNLALKQMAQEQKIDGFAAECWSGFPGELGLNPCMGFLEDAYVLACEGDVMLCVSLLIIRFLNSSIPFAGDLYDLDLDGVLTLTHCGAPASLALNKGEVVLAKSQLALERGFDTMTCRPQLERGPVTVFRFYGTECDKLHLASGELISCEQSPNLTVKIKINGDRWDFLEQCFGNHYLAVAGDVRSELKLLCKWLGVTIFETTPRGQIL